MKLLRQCRSLTASWAKLACFVSVQIFGSFCSLRAACLLVLLPLRPLSFSLLSSVVFVAILENNYHSCFFFDVRICFRSCFFFLLFFAIFASFLFFRFCSLFSVFCFFSIQFFGVFALGGTRFEELRYVYAAPAAYPRGLAAAVLLRCVLRSLPLLRQDCKVRFDLFSFFKSNSTCFAPFSGEQGFKGLRVL